MKPETAEFIRSILDACNIVQLIAEGGLDSPRVVVVIKGQQEHQRLVVDNDGGPVETVQFLRDIADEIESGKGEYSRESKASLTERIMFGDASGE